MAPETLQVGPSEIPALSTAVRVAGRYHMDSRHARFSPRLAPRHLHQLPEVSVRTRYSARRRSSIGSTCRTPAITASTKTASCWRATRAMHRNAHLDAFSQAAFRCPSVSTPADQLRFADSRSTPPDRATLRPGFQSAAPVRWSTAPSCACHRPRFPGLAIRQLRALSRYGQRIHQCRRRLDQRAAHSSAGSRYMQGAHARRLLQIHPHLPVRQAQRPQRDNKASAASTTSLTRPDLACATIRRSGLFASISVIT